MAARYFDLIREMRSAYNHRLRLVESVRQRGIKPTARLFRASSLTARIPHILSVAPGEGQAAQPP